MSEAPYSREPRPYVFDPVSEPEYFHGVLSRRFVAFLLDAVIVAVPIAMAGLVIFVFGFLTLGLGWFLFSLVGPASVVWALIYAGLTLGGRQSATLGMRAMGVEMRQLDGAPMTPTLAVVSVVLFWVATSVFTPLVAVVALFNGRKRLLHDFIIGTVVVNNEARILELSRYR